MVYPKIVLITCVSFLTLHPIFSKEQTGDVEIETEFLKEPKSLKELEEYLHSLELVDEIEPQHVAPEAAKDYFDIDRRKIIASKYLDQLESIKQDWIDPFDMGGLTLNKISDQVDIKKTVKEQASVPPPIVTKEDSPTVTKDLPTVTKEVSPPVIIKETHSSTSNMETFITPMKQEPCLLDNVYIPRWLKKLILRIEKESDMDFSTISFDLDSKSLDSIKEISKAKSFDVNVFDETLSNLIAQAIITRPKSYVEATSSYYNNILWMTAYVSCITVFVYALHRSFLRQPRLTIIGCIVVITVFWHWMHLYQQKKAHHHAELSSMQIPAQCKKHDLGLLEHMQEYLKSFFTTTECRKYYEALLVDPLWEVSLTVAATEAVTATLFQPLFASSRAMNAFIKQLFDGLPLFLNVMLVIFIFFFTIMKMGYKVNLPFWLGRIEPCYPVAGSRVEEVERTRSLPTLIDTVLNAASSSESTQAILEDSNRRTSVAEATKESRSKSIEYSVDKDGIGTCTYTETSTTHNVTDPQSLLSESSISEEGLALRSGYFEVVSVDHDLKSIERRYSDTEDYLSVENDSNTKDSTATRSTNSFATSANLEAVAKNDLEGPEISTEANLDSASSTTSSDEDDKQEFSNLPKALSDSFEIIPRSEESNSESMTGSRIAGPNCDTSQDLLKELHRGCKYCSK